MKKINIAIFFSAILVMTGCGLNNDRGELTGVPGRRPWFHPQPMGTVYVPTGTFHAGQADDDIWQTHISPNKQLTVAGFYMDDTEITNNEYRQFVNYVLDSMARYLLEDPYIIEDEDGNQHQNFDEQIPWGKESEKENLEDALSSIMLKESERYYKRKAIDTRKLVYYYEWIDIKAAAMASHDAERSQFVRREKVRVYPDTLTFVRDFAYSFNEPMTQMYFWHPKFDDYPVVGVNWDQAKAFCNWRTGYLNDYYTSIGEPIVNPFRLPSEYEWEYAARGGRDGSMYPWGGPYTRNSKGCFLANFKPGRGDYQADGGFYPVRAYSYFPNDYGLYGMAGNVAEWTRSAYEDASHVFTDDMNSEHEFDANIYPEEDKYLGRPNPNLSYTMRRKVIRGGSWKDIAYYMQNGSRTYEYQDTAKSFVGFRCVMSYMGRSNKDRNP